MDRPLIVWAKLTLRLALTLLALGVLPVLLVRYVLTGIDSPIPFLLLFLVAPLGARPSDLQRLGDADFNVVMYPEVAGQAASWVGDRLRGT